MPGLPSGTVTFLFTDIEGSTRLWDEQPKSMGSALARHDELLRAAIEDHDGYVFKTIGDAFCAAFHTAPSALNAGLQAQISLLSEPWPDAIKVRVRMAIHTGAAELRDSDYFGPPLNRIARLLSTGHGGQMLLSLATEELVRDSLPNRVSLLDLGEHRLRDLSRPESVFQLLHPDLSNEFPALKSLDRFPNNLPRQLTSFIGREREIAEVEDRLGKSGLLTLTGSGGCGKTRLSLQVAADLLEQYQDGVWLVELAPLSDPGLVAKEVAFTLGLAEQAGKSLLQTLADYLRPKRLLLVLDNCEHLLPTCAELCNHVLRSCGELTILASSREAMGIGGEQTYRVPSLTLPDPNHRVTVEQLSQFEAVRLFLERVRSGKPDYSVTNQTAPALAAVCHRLDGIPLAIELAAARVRSLSLDEINTRLDNRFRLLTGGSKAALPRHQTLRALIDWSYDLLGEQERLLLARLSVFAGGWTLEAAEQVASGDGIEGWEILDLLSSLIDKSLTIADTRETETRYRLLETVKQYALERLTESRELEPMRVRHRDYFLGLAETAAPRLTGSEQKRWFEVLAEEHDNMRLAIAFCLEESDRAEAGLRLAVALTRFWEVRGHWVEGRKHLSALLGLETEPRPHVARALLAAGVLSANLNDLTTARDLLDKSLEMSRQLGDEQCGARALHYLGDMAYMQNDRATARTFFEEALKLGRDAGYQWGVAETLHYLGIVLGDPGIHEESLETRRTLGDKLGVAESLGVLGELASAQGNFPRALALLDESLAIRRDMGYRWGTAHSLSNLGWLALNQGQFDKARVLLDEAVTTFRDLGNQWFTAISLSYMGYLAFYEGDYLASRAFFEDGLVIYREIGATFGAAGNLGALGRVAIKRGDFVGGCALLRESVDIYLKGGHRRLPNCIAGFAELAQAQDHFLRAAKLWGSSTSTQEALGTPRTAVMQQMFERATEELSAAMGDAAFATAYEEGRSMTPEAAVEYAMSLSDS